MTTTSPANGATGRQERIDVCGLLARIPLFSQLSPGHLAAVAEGTRERRLAKDEMLFQKGDAARGFFVVVFGQIKLVVPSPQGEEKIVNLMGPRQSFGEAVMFLETHYPLFAQALVDTLVLHIPRNVVFTLLDGDHAFARRMLAGLSMRLHSLIADVETYSLRSSVQRVIGYLLQLCPENIGGRNVEVLLPVGKQVIASRLNLTPETLSRVFHDLSEARLISVRGRTIAIADPARLREFDT